MLTGLEILIARMKDHPEEFLTQRKWDELIAEFGEYFTKEELDAYKTARSEMMRDLFNEAVLKRLAGEESPPPPSTVKYKAQERYNQAWTDPQGVFGQALAKREGGQVYDPTLARIYSEQHGLQNNIDFKPFV